MLVLNRQTSKLTKGRTLTLCRSPPSHCLRARAALRRPRARGAHGAMRVALDSAWGVPKLAEVLRGGARSMGQCACVVSPLNMFEWPF